MPTTTSRLLTLLSLLQSRRDWPGAVLAERLEISHRTVRRDVDRLREMGYRIHAVKGPDGGYRLEAGSDLPPLLFDDEQTVALAVALQAATISGLGIEEAAMRALTTVRQVMPSRLRHRLDAVRFTTLQRGPGTPSPVSPDVLIALSTAARAREVIRFDYVSSSETAEESSDEPRPPRRVEPHDIVTAQGRWYLVAWDLDHNEWRLFRADRITPRSPGGARFTPRAIPGGSAAAFVAARFKGSETVNAWPCVGTVILDLPARKVAPFAGDGLVEDLGDGRCSLESGSWSWLSLAASLGRFDADIEVVSPPELSSAFAQLGRRYLEASGTA